MKLLSEKRYPKNTRTIICKICDSEKSILEFYASNKSTCKECYKQRVLNRYHNGPGKASQRERHLRINYNLTSEAWDELLESQGGGCAICQSSENLCVDHCHITNKIRGILCSSCNRAIGSLGDSAESVERALRYLRKSEVENVESA